MERKLVYLKRCDGFQDVFVAKRLGKPGGKTVTCTVYKLEEYHVATPDGAGATIRLLQNQTLPRGDKRYWYWWLQNKHDPWESNTYY